MSAHLGLRSYPWEMLKCGESLKKKKRKRGEFPSESPTSIREDELCCCLHGGNSQTAAGVKGAVSCRAKAAPVQAVLLCHLRPLTASVWFSLPISLIYLV